ALAVEEQGVAVAVDRHRDDARLHGGLDIGHARPALALVGRAPGARLLAVAAGGREVADGDERSAYRVVGGVPDRDAAAALGHARVALHRPGPGDVEHALGDDSRG